MKTSEPLWIQSPPEGAGVEAWLEAGDALLRLIPGSDFETFESLPKRDQLLGFALVDALLRCGREAARQDPDLAREWFQKNNGDIRARLGEFYTDF